MEASALTRAQIAADWLLAIDPGSERSAWLTFNCKLRILGAMGHEPNEEVVERCGLWAGSGMFTLLAVEMVASYGMAVGKDVFETVLWTGRFIEAFQPGEYRKVYRKEVKQHLCGSTRATDANVRVALIDMFGGSKERSVGTKKAPGPLYGVSSHLWSALAVAVTAAELAP
jgi:hypothetical protein